MNKIRKIIPTIIIALLIISTLHSTSYANELEYTEKDYKKLQEEYHILRITNESLNNDKEKLEKEMADIKNQMELLNRIVAQGEAKNIPVLLYHHILPEKDIEQYGWKGNESVISLENFKSQMNYLKEKGYYTASLKELEQFIKGERKLPKKTVILTFDDGYISNIVHGYPILKEYGYKATMFVIGDTELREKEEYSPATTQRIYIPEADNYRDVFEFGCHTYDFHSIENGKTKLQTLDKESIIEDLQKSKSLLNAEAIAYPFGKYNDTSIAASQEVGYKLGFTIKNEYTKLGISPYKVPRIVISPRTTLENFINIVNPK